jgi:hypothetical protein
MGLHESASTRVAASPDAVFSRITDISKLPEWNRAITEVIEAPEQLTVESIWKVRIHAMGTKWVSRSTLAEINQAARSFAYRSQTDDGNPSYADWEWHVLPDGNASTVTVSANINPLTFWRKHLLVKVRRPVLRKEIQSSLSALNATMNANG